MIDHILVQILFFAFLSPHPVVVLYQILKTLAMMPAGAMLINIGRGEHVVDDDLIAALDSGHLSAAALDATSPEPLPKDSPLWTHPRVAVLPHVARRPNVAQLAPQIIANIKRFEAGKPLLQEIDFSSGY